jgi:hypothetical protein
MSLAGLHRVSVSLALTLVCAAPATAFAQTSTSSPAGPVPPALINARSVFVSNSGSDRDLFPGVYSQGRQIPYFYSGDDSRPYSEFYSALAATRDYQLAADPSQADLVLEVQLRGHLGSAGPVAELRLIVYSRPTHYVLWTITQTIEPAALQKNRDKNFDEAITNLINQFLEVAGKLPVPAH